MNGPQTTRKPVTRLSGGAVERVEDEIAVERALEMRIDGRPLAVTLRTPGRDRELALGFLAGERLIRRPEDVRAARETPAACGDEPDLLELELAPGLSLDWSRLERHFAATAACGLCGRAHLEALRTGLTPIEPGLPIEPEAIAGLPARLRKAQVAFAATGALHAAAYCDASLDLLALREDVGRHNAVDKIAGWLVGTGRYPAGTGLLWATGRAGAEIALKAEIGRAHV